MKKIFLFIMALFIFCGSISSTYAHSGRTDSRGCHRDRKNGGYHCH